MAFSELVVLGLGSNRGNSRLIIEEAAAELKKFLHDFRMASLIETAPLHVTDQPRFLNTVVTGFCPLEPGDLLETIHRIEAAGGRDRSRERRWGERTLDIDILLYGDRIVREPPFLEIPHPRLPERRFALEPLLELLPEAREPGTGIPYRQICAALPEWTGGTFTY